MRRRGPQRIHEGDRIGHWTVLAQAEPIDGRNRKWLCECDCGKRREVLERSLVYGDSVSCGCVRKKRATQAALPDLTGMQFGELTVVRKVQTDLPNSSARWLCKCQCGEEYVVQGTLLFTGKRTRCSGKTHEKKYAFVDITGQRFGRLTALYPAKRNDKRGSIIWHCRCDCGNETDISYNALLYTHQKSCGCQKKEHNAKLASYLTHVAGTSVDMLRSKKLPADNTTGYKGVYQMRGKYIAKIVFQKKQYFLGSYDRIEEAAQARSKAEAVLFDSVAEHYRQWKLRADADPVWAEQNPVEVIVGRKEDRGLEVTLLPVL